MTEMETHNATPAQAAIPNALTLARLVLTAVVIVLMALHHHPQANLWALPAAAALFIIAAATDALDGYLARKWRVVSTFGRVMDPFADKVLVLGAFIMLAGPSFANEAGEPVAGVAAWMAVVILARELLVTSIRSVMEAGGVSFGANWAGKAKMILQSAAVPLVLLILWIGPRNERLDPTGWGRAAIDVIVWLTLLVTVISGIPYITAAVRSGMGADGTRSR